MRLTPTTIHQRLLLKLAVQIQDYLDDNLLGEAFISPCDVYLNDEQDVVQPDIFIVKKGREDIIRTKGVYGSPDVVIEILSSNKVHDQQRKMELYRLSAVPEYIIIDPETKNIWSYLLNGTTYDEKVMPTGKLFIAQLGFTIEF